MELDVKEEALEAEDRIRGHIRETPLEHSVYLSRLANCRVHLKLENLQITHSFKLRGAVNKFLSLGEEEQRGHFVTASSGNHGSAFAYVLKRFGARGTIYLPENASPAKIETLRLYGADLELHGDDCIISEMFAKKTAEEKGLTWVSPYNDPKIIGGQGTIGIELTRQLDTIDAVLVPVGGGGLIGGIAGYLKAVNPSIEIIGCQPVNSAVMYESVRAGKILDLPSKPTISDGTAGGMEPGAMTLDLCTAYVDDWILVTEAEIAESLRLLVEREYLLAEGSGALSVASFIKARDRFENRNVVCVVSGGKISLSTLKQVLEAI
jgi:threonine dehydratase